MPFIYRGGITIPMIDTFATVIFRFIKRKIIHETEEYEGYCFLTALQICSHWHGNKFSLIQVSLSRPYGFLSPVEVLSEYRWKWMVMDSNYQASMVSWHNLPLAWKWRRVMLQMGQILCYLHHIISWPNGQTQSLQFAFPSKCRDKEHCFRVHILQQEFCPELPYLQSLQGRVYHLPPVVEIPSNGCTEVLARNESCHHLMSSVFTLSSFHAFLWASGFCTKQTSRKHQQKHHWGIKLIWCPQ